MGRFCQSCTVYHVLTFLLTFFSYTLLHASRKTFSNVKSTMVAVWTAQNKSLPNVFDGEEWSGHEIFETAYAAENFLGILDAIFMFCYATGLFINGILGDRFDPRLVLAFGMWGSAITNFLFGTLTEWLQFYSIPFYVIIWTANGFVQSAGWPAEVCIMANWFGRGGRGLILGLWSACASIGNIVGAELAALVLPYGYEYTFLVNATLLFCGGFVIFFGLVSKPSQLCLPEPTEEEEEEENAADDASSTTTDEEQDLLGSVTDVKKCNQQKSIPFFKAVLLPGVISYSVAFACLKLVNYSIFFWLPYYLTNHFGWPEHVADHISTWFDWGGIFGGIIGGLISDLIGKRTPVICTQLAFATAALFAYTKSPNDMVINALLMGVAGFFCSGPGNLISAAVSADLGRQKEVANNAQAMSTVTGIVDGTGSVGAAIGQLAIPHLQAKLGWNSVFYLFVCMTAVTVLCLLQLCIKECRQVYLARKYRRLEIVAEDENA